MNFWTAQAPVTLECQASAPVLKCLPGGRAVQALGTAGAPALAAFPQRTEQLAAVLGLGMGTPGD